MALEDINFDFDVNKFFGAIKDSLFKTVKVILTMFFNLPFKVKVTIAVFVVLIVIGIAILVWKYRDEWHYVKY